MQIIEAALGYGLTALVTLAKMAVTIGIMGGLAIAGAAMVDRFGGRTTC